MKPTKKLRQNFEFVRYTPIARICRRISSRIRLKILSRITKSSPLALQTKISRLNDTLELPSVTAPHGSIRKNANVWEVEFLHHTEKMEGSIDWTIFATDPNKQLWRMNLHYFEYLPSIRIELATELIEDWIANCRPYSAISNSASWTPYGISLRISAWIAFITANPNLNDENFKTLFASSLIEQANYLSNNLETDIMGNHVIKNLRALYEANSYLKNNSNSRWQPIADKLLSQQLKEQILDDGVHFELSMSYHCQVFADLLVIYHLRPDDKLNRSLGFVLKRMTKPLRELVHPDGYVAQFNDAGLQMCISPASCLNEYEKHIELRATITDGAFAYPNAGYYGYSSTSSYLVIKMGKLGPDELMAHAHADWGSFEWSYKGCRVIVDQGVYEYISGDKRNQCRASTSHNTLVANGVEQAEFIGPFRCGRRPNSMNPKFTAEENGFSLDGTLPIRGDGTMTELHRRISATEEQISISDECLNKEQSITSSLLIHPQWELSRVNDRKILFSNAAQEMIELVAELEGELEIEDATWWPNMGIEQATKRLVFKSEANKLSFSIVPCS